jgi:hypothetical protein
MKILKDCWDGISAADCDFGSYVFKDSTVAIYVHDGIDVGTEMSSLFLRKNDVGFVGHCFLVFRGVKSLNFAVSAYEKVDSSIVWGECVVDRYEGQVVGATKKYFLGGGLHGRLASVEVELDAQEFEIHVLDNDELIEFPD